jgi:hypothetical protein
MKTNTHFRFVAVVLLLAGCGDSLQDRFVQAQDELAVSREKVVQLTHRLKESEEKRSLYEKESAQNFRSVERLQKELDAAKNKIERHEQSASEYSQHDKVVEAFERNKVKLEEAERKFSALSDEYAGFKKNATEEADRQRRFLKNAEFREMASWFSDAEPLTSADMETFSSIRLEITIPKMGSDEALLTFHTKLYNPTRPPVLQIDTVRVEASRVEIDPKTGLGKAFFPNPKAIETSLAMTRASKCAVLFQHSNDEFTIEFTPSPVQQKITARILPFELTGIRSKSNSFVRTESGWKVQ